MEKTKATALGGTEWSGFNRAVTVGFEYSRREVGKSWTVGHRLAKTLCNRETEKWMVESAGVRVLTVCRHDEAKIHHAPEEDLVVFENL